MPAAHNRQGRVNAVERWNASDEGPGGSPAAESVGPDSGVEQAPASGAGHVGIPVGRPVSEEEWAEMKRRAEEPDEPQPPSDPG
jgi:hypothetical protein